MKLKTRVWLLSCLAVLAAFTGVEAYGTLYTKSADTLPGEIYASLANKAQSAEYYLRPSGDYVAVFGERRGNEPLSVTDIEVAGLRGADRAMLEKGIPVAGRDQLLALLEDLGS